LALVHTNSAVVHTDSVTVSLINLFGISYQENLSANSGVHERWRRAALPPFDP
jgi:hypothetical protein